MKIPQIRCSDVNAVKRIIFLWVLLIPFCLAGCSSDDDEGDNGGEGPNEDAPVSYVLGSGNTNMPSSGTIIAQYADAPVGSEIRRLVDDNADTKYVTYHSSFNITWNGNSSKAVTAYSLTSAADTPEMDPKDWTLYGSNDNTTWTELDAQTNQLFAARKEEKSYEVDNATSYRYYRLSVEANNGGAATQIAEWKLVAMRSYTENINDLIASKGSSTFSAITPMGRQHENDREATAADLKWLADPAEEPEPFGDGGTKMAWNTFNVVSIYPNGNPVMSDVNQRWVGDCCACAVIASMAYLYPRFVKHIIKDNMDKTYTVTMYDPKGKQISVGVGGDYFIGNSGDLGALGGRNKEVTWATILEKAMIKWNQIYQGSSNVGGIGTEYVSAIFTGDGESVGFGANALIAEDLQRAVEVSLKQGRLVIGGFTRSGEQVDQNWQTTSGHAFTFILPDDNTHLFKMRNPWGGTTDGVMKVKDDGRIPPMIDLRICAPGDFGRFHQRCGHRHGRQDPSGIPAGSAGNHQAHRGPAGDVRHGRRPDSGDG